MFLRNGQKGVSIIEITVVLAIIGFLAILVASFPNAMALIGKTRHLSVASEIASKKMEDLRAMQYINLSLGEEEISDPRLGLLPSGSGKVLVEDCYPEICTQSEDTKKVTVTVTWRDYGKDQIVNLTTLISDGGLNQ